MTVRTYTAVSKGSRRRGLHRWFTTSNCQLLNFLSVNALVSQVRSHSAQAQTICPTPLCAVLPACSTYEHRSSVLRTKCDRWGRSQKIHLHSVRCEQALWIRCEHGLGKRLYCFTFVQEALSIVVLGPAHAALAPPQIADKSDRRARSLIYLAEHQKLANIRRRRCSI